MKKLIFAVLGLSTLIGVAMYVSRNSTPAVPAEEAVAVEPSPAIDNGAPLAARTPRARAHTPSPVNVDSGFQHKPRPRIETPKDPAMESSDALAVTHAVDLLVSPDVELGDKHTTWNKLRESGKLDDVIRELERRAAEDVYTAAYPATLGQAYLQKCSTLQDVREQGILGMQADKMFDTALNIDPSNWEARFTKAVALSYWPAELKKGPEVIEHYQTLIRQQEIAPPRPHFAETYLLLGDQYKKSGQLENAQAVWNRGAGLFPNHEGLQSRLNPTQ